MHIDQLRTYKKILIAGYGVEGKSTEAFLRKYHPGAQVTIADRLDGEDYLKRQTSFDIAIKTPSIAPASIIIPYTTQANIFFANTTQKKIGITGSKGKSTTSALLHYVLTNGNISAKLLGNIGYPMLDYFLGDMKEDDVFVIELSSYQLADIRYSPHIACFLNIFADHIVQHGSFQEYFKAKSNIVKYSLESDYFVFNGAFPEIARLAQTTLAQSIDIAQSTKQMPKNQYLSTDTIVAVREMAKLCNISDEIFNKSVLSFPGLPHRLQRIGEFRGITFINDSSATTPEAAIFALKHVPKVDTLILGGLDRKLDIQELVDVAISRGVSNYILFPDTQEKIKHALRKGGVSESAIFLCLNMHEAVRVCYQHAGDGGVCLLSPGFASYNSYKNFCARGDDFMQLVTQLSNQ